MRNRASLTLPNDMAFWKPLKSFYNALCDTISFPSKERTELLEALFELFENAVIHAYGKEEGEIWIDFEIFHNGVKIDVRDKGMPIDPRIIKVVPIDCKNKNRGLNRIYTLVDSFKYFNLGLQGKQFSIVKFTPVSLRLKESQGFYSDIGDDFDQNAKEILRDRLLVRPFRAGDEVWIPRLIYKNYGYTYFKDLFYYPEKILQKEQTGEILSIVAEVDEQIVGHFALVKLQKSNIAEIGIAVVDPAFKGMGIMKEMFKLLIQKAKELGLDALFGEAITFHPYSQRANARFGFKTTALLLGDIHQMVRLKDHKYPFRQKRGAVALEYKLLKPFTKKIALPKRYAPIIQKTYNLLELPFTPLTIKNNAASSIQLEHNPLFAITTLVIDGYRKDFEQVLKQRFEEAIAKHPDMIYADINLEKVASIDTVVELLREYGFFYAGVIFLRRKSCDYLRLQFEASENIEEQHIVCYSDFCKELHQFILEDKARL